MEPIPVLEMLKEVIGLSEQFFKGYKMNNTKVDILKAF